MSEEEQELDIESEIEEQDWKEAKIAEYAKQEANAEKARSQMENDPELIDLIAERKKLNAKIDILNAPYLTWMETARGKQAEIKIKLIDNWDVTEKTFKCDAGTATLRTAKSLRIRSKAKLIDFLSLNKKLTEYIKAFDTSKLRKIKEAELIGSDVIDWDEKKSVAISLVETAVLEEDK